MVETWKVIDGYENYEVSDLGRVRSLDRPEHWNGVIRQRKGRMLRQQHNKQGYKLVALFKNGIAKRILVHRLVAFAFPEICGEYFEGAQINHKDEIRDNNVAWNLEWCTCKYNHEYGSHDQKMIESLRHNRLCKKVYQYDIDGNLMKEWTSTKEIFRILGYDPGNIANVCRGLKNTSHGFIWHYASDS